MEFATDEYYHHDTESSPDDNVSVRPMQIRFEGGQKRSKIQEINIIANAYLVVSTKV